MDEAGLCFFGLLLIASWRVLLMRCPRIRNGFVTPLEKRIGDGMVNCCGHRGAEGAESLDCQYWFGKGTPFFEWWFLATVGLTWMLTNNFVDVVIFDYVLLHRLCDIEGFSYNDAIDKNFNDTIFAVGNVTTFDQRVVSMEDLRDELHIPLWIRGIAMAAPSIGVLAFGIFLAHLRSFVVNYMKQNMELMLRKPVGDELHCVDDKVEVTRDNHTYVGIVKVVDTKDANELPYKVEYFDGGKKIQDWLGADDVTKIKEDFNPWVADSHEDLAILVIMMPAVFIMMAMKAEIRMLQLMMATSTHDAKDWFTFEMPLIGEKNIDMELSAICQFVVVFAFATLAKTFFNLNVIEQKVRKRETQLELEINKLNKNGGKIEMEPGLNAEDIIKVIANAGDQHRTSLSRAGLMGVWAHILVGILRALLTIIVAILLQTKDQEVRGMVAAQQTKALAYLEPVFSFSTLLCMVNMTVILKMDDLTEDSAFGKHASVKFLAARVLIILGDTQLTVVKNAAKVLLKLFKYNVSIYNIQLLHVCLLEIECLALVVFNSYMWKETVRSRSEITWNLVRGQTQKAIKQFQRQSFQTLLALCLGMPMAILCLVLLLGTSKGGGPVEDPPQPPVLKIFDVLMQSFGMGMTYIPFLLSLLCFGWTPSFLDKNHNSQFGWLPRTWRPAQLVVLTMIVWSRWVMLCFVGPYHGYFSNHVFLGMSVLCAVSMDLALATVAYFRGFKSFVSIVVFGSGMGIFASLLFWDLWGTAMYYHTVEATWLAYGLGLLTFIPVSWWWVARVSTKPEERGANEVEQPLVTNEKA